MGLRSPEFFCGFLFISLPLHFLKNVPLFTTDVFVSFVHTKINTRRLTYIQVYVCIHTYTNLEVMNGGSPQLSSHKNVVRLHTWFSLRESVRV
jgi:hypothetical protein